MKTTIAFLITLLIGCLEPLQDVRAVTPPPDGGYPGGNTAEGDNALLNLTNGQYDTALGLGSLETNAGGNFNTAVGAAALFLNAAANENTAIGAAALFTNAPPFANGGNGNTANGAFALFHSSTGSLNTAIGDRALLGNTTGNNNTASGDHALLNNTTGAGNTAIGSNALANSTSGSGNIALGNSAGSSVMTASNVICIGSAGANNPGTCYIGNVFGVSTPSGVQVYINSSGKLGAIGSSRRFKEEIKPMGRRSEALYALEPVSFHYKKEIDPQGVPQFGLVAEDVEQVNPDLVVRDNEGKTYSVRYDQINAMLLNEFLKEHRKVEQLEKQIKALTAGLQKVSAQLEVNKLAPQTVQNN